MPASADGDNPWDSVIVVEITHASTIVFTAAVLRSTTLVAAFALAQAMISLAFILSCVASKRSRTSRAVTAARALPISFLFLLVFVITQGQGEIEMMFVPFVSALVFDVTVFLLYPWLRGRQGTSVRRHWRRRASFHEGSWERRDLVILFAALNVAVAVASSVDQRMVADVRVAYAIVLLLAMSLPHTTSTWASSIALRLANGHISSARRAWQRSLALEIPIYAAAAVAFGMVGPELSRFLLPEDHGTAATMMAAGAWLIPARALGRAVRPLSPSIPSILAMAAFCVVAAIVFTIPRGVDAIWPLVLPTVGWLAWSLSMARRCHTAEPRYVAPVAAALGGPAVRGMMGALAIGAGSERLLSAARSLDIAAAALLIGVGLLLLLSELIRGVDGVRARRSVAGRHALIAPGGHPSLLGGPRSAMEGWSISCVDVEVLTATGSPAADFARSRQLTVHPVRPPDPRHSSWQRWLVAVRWLCWDGVKLARFESVEVEANHLREVLPAAKWFGVPVVAAVRGFPYRVPSSRLRRWLYTSPESVYCINEGIRVWLAENAGRADARVVWIPVLDGTPLFELAAARRIKTVVIVGELRQEKGQLAFVQQVVPSLVGWETRLVGGHGRDPSYVRELEDSAFNSDNPVTLVGQTERWQYEMGGRFVLAINSDREGGPRVAVEALAAGIPVVMRNFPGSEAFVNAPFVWIVNEVSEWRHAVECAYRSDLDPHRGAVLAAFLSRYRRNAVAARLTAFWLGAPPPAEEWGAGHGYDDFAAVP